MAASRLRLSGSAPLPTPLLSVLLVLVISCSGSLSQIQIDGSSSSSVSSNVAPSSVSGLLLQSALDALGERRPYQPDTAHLVAANKLIRSPYTIYKLTINIAPVCESIKKVCLRETCSLDVRQHEQGVIDVLQDSINCKSENIPEQQITENIEKQIINQSTSLDREVQISPDHNDRPFIAVKANQSDYCPGCPYELNPSLPGLSAFGDQVLQAMDEAGISDFRHKLISIVRVTRSVPPSSNVVQYQLLMEIGESNCLKTSLIEISKCSTQSNLPIKLCLVTFEERPWLVGSRKITKNNCTDLLNTDNEVNGRVDPNSLFSEIVGVNNKDDDTSTKTEFDDQIAQEAQEVRIPSMDMSTQDPHRGKDATRTKESSESSQSKAVDEKTEGKHESGRFSEKVKEFDEFLKDFDIPIKTETSSSKQDGGSVTEETIVLDDEQKPSTVQANERIGQFQVPFVESIRTKRSAKLLDSNKMILRKLAVKGVELIDDSDEDNKKTFFMKMIDSGRERQDHTIVYHFKAEVSATDCSEREQSTECLDEIIPGPTQICKYDMAVNEKKPLLSPKLLHYECKMNQKSETRFKREIVGAPRSISKDDPQIQEYIQKGLRKYSETFQPQAEPVVGEIKDVTVQIVQGSLYKIITDIRTKSCKEGAANDCQIEGSEKIEECLIKVWSRPWLDEGNPEITVECNNKDRIKRSLRGQNYSQKMLAQSRELKEIKLFHEFMIEFNKIYDNEEEKERRFQIFRNNLDMIEELQRNEQGTGRYGVTQFTDLTKAEFKAKYLGLKSTLRSENDIPLPMANIPDIELPTEYDWRHYNAVTPVKNQGQCGSCWAFSVTGNVEGQYAIRHGKLLSFSEQELVDCDKLDEGCNGGLPDSAYRALEDLGGLELESDYPYDGVNEKCHFNKKKVRVSVVSGLNITSNETQMAQWLVKNGPMSIGINANAMQFYVGGVSHPFHFLCSPADLDHGVLIVGYGIKSYPIFKKKLPYWIVKNSWGPHWGEQGYYRVYRGDGSCGVNKMVSSAVIA